MKCLVDADILVYECASGGQYVDQNGVLVYKPFDQVAEHVDHKIKLIEEACWATEPSLLFFTGDEKLLKMEKEGVTFKENFRYKLAITKPYKGTRKDEKPYHYDNLRAYMLSAYSYVIANGYEADDAICSMLVKNDEYIACSRDKDLRQTPGWHYAWECGEIPSWGPQKVDELGKLWWEGKKLRGYGTKWFFAQMIMGDSVDNIPGLPRGGPALAYKTLADLVEENDCYLATKALYDEKGMTEDYWWEMWHLLWIRRNVWEDHLES